MMTEREFVLTSAYIKVISNITTYLCCLLRWPYLWRVWRMCTSMIHEYAIVDRPKPAYSFCISQWRST